MGIKQLYEIFTKSLRIRLTLFILVAFLASTWLLVVIFSELLKRDLEQVFGTQQYSSASVLAAHTNFELASRVKTLENLAARISPAIMHNLPALQKLLDDRVTLQHLLNAGFYVVDAKGIVIADVLKDRKRVGMDVSGRSWIQQALAGKPTVGEPIQCKIRKTPIITIAVPIWGDSGTTRGVLAGVIDLAQPNFLDDIGDSRYGKTGTYTLLSAPHRKIVTASDKSRSLELLPAAGTDPAMDRIIAGHEGSLVRLNKSGIKVLAAAKKIPVADWILVVSLPTTEAFAAIGSMQRGMTGTALFLSVLFCVPIWWLLHHHLAPVFSTITQMKMLARSEQLPQSLPLARKDEVGELINTFNVMLEKVKQREQALKESNTNYLRLAGEKDAVLHASPVGICMMRERIVVWSNQAFDRMLGYAPDTTKGLNTLVLYPDRAAYEEAGRRAYPALAQGLPWAFSTRMKRADGSLLWCSLTGCLLNPDNPDDGSIWIFQDITEQKQEEERKQLEEKRLKMQISILQFQAETIQQFIDNALNEAIDLTSSNIGYIYFYNEDTQEFILNSWSRGVMDACAVMNPQTCYHLEKTGVWGEAIRQRKPIVLNQFQSEHPLKRGYPEGHVHLTNFLTVPVIKNERIVAVVGVGNKSGDYEQTDILQLTLLMDTVWNHVEIRKVEDERTYLADIIEQSLNEIYLFDPETLKFIYINQGALRNLQYTHQELLTQRAFDIKPELDEAAFRRILQPLLDQQTQKIVFETVHQRADGSCYPVEVNLQLLPMGGKRGFLAVINDITERKQEELKNARLIERLHQSQKLESIGRLAGGVAHDFNNKLMIILGNAELAQFDIEDRQKMLAHLQDIKCAAEHSRDITAQLLTFSRKQSIVPKVTDINETINTLHKSLSRLIGENITFSFLPGEQLWNTLIDPVQVDQIVMNMAVNARDAMIDGGIFTVETRNVSLTRNQLSQGADCIVGDYVKITFRDNGPGIPEQIQHHIFEPFFTTKDVGKGTGLGLATIYGIVQQNNGYIEVSNNVAGGAVFNVYLPRHDKPLEIPGISSDLPVSGKGTILLVEDESALCKMTTQFLQMLGYTVFAAESPTEAIKIAQNADAKFDLILTDVIMPEMNGKALVESIKAVRPAIKVIYTSGFISDAISQEAVDDASFVQKPYELAVLSIKIRQLLAA